MTKIIDAKKWLDKIYPSKEEREETRLLNISKEGLLEKAKEKMPGVARMFLGEPEKLSGELDLSDFTNLEELNCSSNNLSSLYLNNCLKLTKIIANNNQIKEIDLPISNENLKILDLSNNNLSERNLTVFSDFINLEELYLGNTENRIEEKYNRIYGSLKALENLIQLKKLNINNTDIDSGLEYLPDSIENLWCLTCDGSETKVREIYEELKPFTTTPEKGVYNLEEWKKNSILIEGFAELIRGNRGMLEEGDDLLVKKEKEKELLLINLEGLNIQKGRLEQKIRNLLKQIGDLENNSKNELKEAREELEKARKELEEVRKELKIKENDVIVLREKLEQVNSSINDHKKKTTFKVKFASVIKKIITKDSKGTLTPYQIEEVLEGIRQEKLSEERRLLDIFLQNESLEREETIQKLEEEIKGFKNTLATEFALNNVNGWHERLISKNKVAKELCITENEVNNLPLFRETSVFPQENFRQSWIKKLNDVKQNLEIVPSRLGFGGNQDEHEDLVEALKTERDLEKFREIVLNLLRKSYQEAKQSIPTELLSVEDLKEKQDELDESRSLIEELEGRRKKLVDIVEAENYLDLEKKIIELKIQRENYELEELITNFLENKLGKNKRTLLDELLENFNNNSEVEKIKNQLVRFGLTKDDIQNLIIRRKKVSELEKLLETPI